MHRILTKKRRKSNAEKGRKSGREEAKPKETSSKTKQNDNEKETDCLARRA